MVLGEAKRMIGSTQSAERPVPERSTPPWRRRPAEAKPEGCCRRFARAAERRPAEVDHMESRMTQAIEWAAYRGAPLYDEDGNVIGSIEEFFVETDDGPPAWAVVVNEVDPGTRSYVPMRGTRRADDGPGLQVSVDRETVRDAPSTQDGDDLSGEQERQLYEHYGQAYPDRQTSEETSSEKRKPGFLRRLLGRDSR
jgi:hypothetical protein